jgi:hypothetical protein
MRLMAFDLAERASKSEGVVATTPAVSSHLSFRSPSCFSFSARSSRPPFLRLFCFSLCVFCTAGPCGILAPLRLFFVQRLASFRPLSVRLPSPQSIIPTLRPCLAAGAAFVALFGHNGALPFVTVVVVSSAGRSSSTATVARGGGGMLIITASASCPHCKWAAMASFIMDGGA